MGLISGRVLAESEPLLASTNLQMKNIAYELGFTDLSHFPNFFRRRKGLNPKAFRELMRTHDTLHLA